MKKILLILLLVLSIQNVEASKCSNQNLSYLKERAQFMSYYYLPTEDNKFNVVFYNVIDDFAIMLNNNIYDVQNQEIIIPSLNPGEKLEFKVLSKVLGICYKKEIKIFYINLPSFNQYYSDPICENQDYYLCNKWVFNKYSYEEFIKQVTNYKNKASEQPKIDEIEQPDKSNLLINFITNYYWVILLLVIVVCVISIYKLNKKNEILVK